METPYSGTNLVFWMGVVEKRDDSIAIGRCKVRIIGWHNHDKSEVKTDQLPWAYPIEPLGGSLFSTPREGETVFGFFLDGTEAQQPVMLGKMPTFEMSKVKMQVKEASQSDHLGEPTDVGFQDARTPDELKKYPRQYFKTRSYTMGTGLSKTEYDAASLYPANLSFNDTGLPSLPFLARNVKDKVPEQLILFPVAQGVATAAGTSWGEPTGVATPVYPFNHVYESESKHVLEFDDTPGKERVKIMHRTGSGTEYHPTGSRVQRIVKDDYEVVIGDKKVAIYGKCDVVIKGSASLAILGDYNVKVKGEYNIHADKIQLKSENDIKIKGRTLQSTIDDNTLLKSGSIQMKSDGTWIQRSASTMYLDSSTDVKVNQPGPAPATPSAPSGKAFDSSPAASLSMIKLVTSANGVGNSAGSNTSSIGGSNSNSGSTSSATGSTGNSPAGCDPSWPTLPMSSWSADDLFNYWMALPDQTEFGSPGYGLQVASIAKYQMREEMLLALGGSNNPTYRSFEDKVVDYLGGNSDYGNVNRWVNANFNVVSGSRFDPATGIAHIWNMSDGTYEVTPANGPPCAIKGSVATSS